MVALEEAQGVLVVPDLGPGIEMLAVVAIANAEIAIVKDQGVDACLCKSLRIDWHDDLADLTPAAGEHDCRRAVGFVGHIQPAPNRGALGLKFDIQPLDHRLLRMVPQSIAFFDEKKAAAGLSMQSGGGWRPSNPLPAIVGNEIDRG